MECKWCKSETKQTDPPEIRPDWGRWVCNGCGAMGFYADPTSDQLCEIYKEAWFDPEKEGSFAAGSTSESIAGSIIKMGISGDFQKKCVDYGSGKGVLAKGLAILGCNEVHAIEPFGPKQEIKGVSWHRDWSDLPKGSRFDVIFMVEVIEHLEDPVEQLKKAKEKLSDGGGILITTPNANGWRSISKKGKWKEAQNPTHINLFSYKALSSCLKKAGFNEIQRVTKTMTYNKRGLSGLALRMTQILRIDGSLKVWAT